jgi:hypothetical protein
MNSSSSDIKKTLNIFTRIIVLLLMTLADNTILAQANTDSIMTQQDSDDIEFNIGIPLWIPAYKGRFTIGDIVIDSEGDSRGGLSEYFPSEGSIDFYYVGKFGMTLKKWQFQGDIFGGSFQNSINFSYNQIPLKDIELVTTMPRIIVGYQVFEHEFELGRLKNKLEIWPYAGCRYYYVDIQKKTFTVIPEFQRTNNWIDPLLGFTVQFMINRFTIFFENDFGGFGLGSEFTYWLQASGEYKVVDFLAIKLGWTYQNINYQEEKGEDSFNYKMELQGPVAGIIFYF